jgi:BarA-like signal transduction histidine kinase
VDYQQTFSLVARGVTFRLALALALAFKKSLKMHQIDVETALTYADWRSCMWTTSSSSLVTRGKRVR